ncbi:MAG: rRNA maturation RNase YbeY [Alphaproteobacteria bacterium]|nr:rRNA maturation RNase YbeY [Alphaproteobacteria bacterium]
MTAVVHVAERSNAWRTALPSAARLGRRAARAALAAAGTTVRCELCIVLADDRLVRRLNRRFRSRDKPTNVLSFALFDPGAAELALGAPPRLLGDVVVSVETVKREALTQHKTVRAHFAHLVVHGVLHLLGYDHGGERQARRMEGLERRVLARLAIADPYVAVQPPPARPRRGARR